MRDTKRRLDFNLGSDSVLIFESISDLHQSTNRMNTAKREKGTAFFIHIYRRIYTSPFFY